MILGYALIAFGLGFLLREVGIIDDSFWRVIWPLMLMAFGLTMISKRTDLPIFDR